MKLKICSFNSRCSTANDGINSFFCRTERIKEFIVNESPDIIGFQEITDEMRDWYTENLPDYYLVGGGRNADLGGESAMIGFKKRDMKLVSCDTVMLSSTPSIPGSRYEGSDQSICPRAYTRAYLKHKSIAEPFYFYNVHTDHTGKLARQLASMQLVQDISSHNKLFFLTGDFNATPDASEIALITASERFVDTTASIEHSFHAYGKLLEPSKIDYIFADGRIACDVCYKVVDEPEDGVYISDHNPIISVFSF